MLQLPADKIQFPIFLGWNKRLYFHFDCLKWYNASEGPVYLIGLIGLI